MIKKDVFLCENATKLSIADKSVNLIITHLPYITLDSLRYGGDYKKQIHFGHNTRKMTKNVVKSAQEMERVLTDNGNLIIAFGNDDKGHQFAFINEIIANTKFFIEDYFIYNYNFGHNKNIMNKEMIIWFHLVKNKNTYYNNKNEIVKNYNSIFHLEGSNISHPIDQKLMIHFPNSNIFDTYNIDFANKIINIFSKEGDVVLDPFGGTGTTAMSSLINKRNFIYNDISELQVEIAKKRINLYEESKGRLQ